MTVARHVIFTDEHEALRASVRRFVDQELRPHVEAWEEAGCFPDDVFRRAGELGFLGLHYPERWGGAGGDLAAELVFVEELARAGCGSIDGVAMSVCTDRAMAIAPQPARASSSTKTSSAARSPPPPPHRSG